MLLQQRNLLMERIRTTEASLDLLPKGKLLIVNNGKYTKWKCSQNGSVTHIPKSNAKLAEQLALRRVQECQLADLKQELHLLDCILRGKMQLKNRTSALLNKSPEFGRLMRSAQQKENNYIEQWLNQKYPSQAPYQDRRIHKTASGINVRSKSEVLIVSRLTYFQIPFLYEFPKSLGNLTIYPDFALLHPVNLSIGYYEHLGMMDNSEYCTKALRKIENYTEFGITPANNLFLTFEDRHHPLSVSDIDACLLRFLRG